jgi:hypothetical protein
MTALDPVHFRSQARKRATLNIPWASALNDCGSWPSTGPDPLASLVLSCKAITHLKVPCWVIADPSLHAVNGESDNLVKISLGENASIT